MVTLLHLTTIRFFVYLGKKKPRSPEGSRAKPASLKTVSRRSRRYINATPLTTYKLWVVFLCLDKQTPQSAEAKSGVLFRRSEGVLFTRPKWGEYTGRTRHLPPINNGCFFVLFRKQRTPKRTPTEKRKKKDSQLIAVSP